MNRLPDPRRPERCLYTQAHLIWTGLLLFLMHLGSRRQMRFERLADSFTRNLALLSGQQGIDTVADPDTLAYYAEHVPVAAVEKLLAWIMRRLIRMKALDPFRLLTYFPVAIDGSQICTFPEAVSLANIQTENRLRVEQNDCIQHFAWAEELPIAEFTPNVLFCRDQPKQGEARQFVWLTNLHLCRNNVESIANNGGRLRWKIEGFNVQKNNGYEMEHPYSEHANGFRIFYILLLIAHIITQLILRGSLIRSLCRTFGSAKNFARRLAESLRNHAAPADLAWPGQIRFQPP
jgi:hypothetical protein